MEIVLAILSALGGGVGVFILKLITDFRKSKHTTKKEAAEAWQQIADRESERLGKLEERIDELEKNIEKCSRVCNIQERYILKLEQIIHGIDPSVILPNRSETETGVCDDFYTKIFKNENENEKEK